MWEKILYFFQVSGWPMYGITACSVFALAVFFEKLTSLRRGRVVPRTLVIEVRELMKQGKISEASLLCKKSSSPLAKIIGVALQNEGKGRERLKEIVNEVGQREAAELEKYMKLLNTTISVAPMLGFLGTVLGMVQLFSNVAQVGEVTNIGLIADGIYKALYTTIAGLTVSIIATLFYRYLSSKADRLFLLMEEITLEVVDLMGEKP